MNESNKTILVPIARGGWMENTKTSSKLSLKSARPYYFTINYVSTEENNTAESRGCHYQLALHYLTPTFTPKADGNYDERSQHTALPVIEGEKWLSKFWTRGMRVLVGTVANSLMLFIYLYFCGKSQSLGLGKSGNSLIRQRLSILQSSFLHFYVFSASVEFQDPYMP